MKVVIIKASGPEHSYAEIRRDGDSMSDPRGPLACLPIREGQQEAYDQAVGHVKAGDVAKAVAALKGAFDKVIVETPWGRRQSIEDIRGMASKLPEMSEKDARDEYEDLCCEGFVSHEQEDRRLAIGQYIQDHFGDL